MNREDIIRMAREADDFADSYTPQYVTLPNEWSVIRDERFFHLAYAAGAAAERNKCRYPDCVDNGPGGKCTRWLVGECEGPSAKDQAQPSSTP